MLTGRNRTRSGGFRTTLYNVKPMETPETAVTITDTQTNKSFTHNYTINIPAAIGANGGYVGFTAGTGGLTAVQDILTWTYSPSASASPRSGRTSSSRFK